MTIKRFWFWFNSDIIIRAVISGDEWYLWGC